MAAGESAKNIPIPDPSALTTDQLRRELGSLREVLETRLAAMDTATALVAMKLEGLTREFNDRLEKQRRERLEQLAATREIMMAQLEIVRAVGDERFAAVAVQFGERDIRTEKAAQEARISLDAALAAAKEAVGEQNKSNTLAIDKSDRNTKEKIDSLVIQISTSIDSLNDKILELRRAVDRSEGKSQGGAAIWAGAIGVAIVVVAVIGLYINATK